MARVTVEDCVDKIPNRYELLMVAAQRAKDISAGAPITVARDNDKNPVIALREIADETVSIEELQKSLVMGLQKYVEVEEPEEEELEIMAAEKELADLIYKYGEERKSRQIAVRIAERRRIKPIETTKELAEIIYTLKQYKLEPKRMRLVHPYIDKEPNMVLIDCAKGGNPRITVDSPLIVYNKDGSYTDEIYQIYGEMKN